MAAIEIYTTPMCPYCLRAKHLLNSKEVTFTEVNLWTSPGRRKEMLKRTGGRTSVPQIFIDGELIGGSDELAALEQEGRLDTLLGKG